MTILLSTEKGISLGLSTICQKSPMESRWSAEFRFRQRVGKAKPKDRLRVINENSIHRFEQITEEKFIGKDSFWNIHYLYVR